MPVPVRRLHTQNLNPEPVGVKCGSVRRVLAVPASSSTPSRFASPSPPPPPFARGVTCGAVLTQEGCGVFLAADNDLRARVCAVHTPIYTPYPSGCALRPRGLRCVLRPRVVRVCAESQSRVQVGEKQAARCVDGRVYSTHACRWTRVRHTSVSSNPCRVQVGEMQASRVASAPGPSTVLLSVMYWR